MLHSFKNLKWDVIFSDWWVVMWADFHIVDSYITEEHFQSGNMNQVADYVYTSVSGSITIRNWFYDDAGVHLNHCQSKSNTKTTTIKIKKKRPIYPY